MSLCPTLGIHNPPKLASQECLEHNYCYMGFVGCCMMAGMCLHDGYATIPGSFCIRVVTRGLLSM